jgi:hypothetical protein
VNQILGRCAMVVLLCSPFLSSLAQTGTAQKDMVITVCDEAIGDRLGYPSGAPFTASWNYTVTTRRADGTTFSEVIPGKISRDSDGRTYFENRIWALGGIEKLSPPSFSVTDPVKHISFSWTAKRTVVSLHNDPNLDTPENKARLLKAPWTKSPWAEPLCFAWDPDGQYQGGQYKVETLGTKTILGLVAEGILTTRVLPAGYKGYDKPVTVTEERWYSADLQLALLNIVDDSRIGRGTWELTNLERTEPSPALFRLPSGYTINVINLSATEENSVTLKKPVGR